MKKKLLVVEDDMMMMNYMKLALKMAGYKVETAENGETAFNLLIDALKKDERFDLIITDALMPDGDGISLLKKLNREKILTPVIAISVLRPTNSVPISGYLFPPKRDRFQVPQSQITETTY